MKTTKTRSPSDVVEQPLPDRCPACGSLELIPDFRDGFGWDCLDCHHSLTGEEMSRTAQRSLASTPRSYEDARPQS